MPGTGVTVALDGGTGVEVTVGAGVAVELGVADSAEVGIAVEVGVAVAEVSVVSPREVMHPLTASGIRSKHNTSKYLIFIFRIFPPKLPGIMEILSKFSCLEVVTSKNQSYVS